MRFSFISIALLGAAASTCATSLVGRQADQYPNCSTPCLVPTSLGSCLGFNDLACICGNDTIVDTITRCMSNSCTNTTDLIKAIELSRLTCRTAGKTLTSLPSYLPSSVASALSSPSPTPTASDASKSDRNILFALGAAAAALSALYL